MLVSDAFVFSLMGLGCITSVQEASRLYRSPGELKCLRAPALPVLHGLRGLLLLGFSRGCRAVAHVRC